MLRHKAYFEALGAMQAPDPAWPSALAGLSILRVVDAIATDPDGDKSSRHAAIDAARTTALAMHEGDPARAILLRTTDILDDRMALTPELASELLKYGKALDLEGAWTFATDVFRTISETFRSPQNEKIVIEALIALGAAARNTGDWETSDRGYAEAQHMADSIGDDSLSLTAQVGIASTLIAHGNFPAADAELREVRAETNRLRLQHVEAIALHASAHRAATSGDYQGAVHFAYQSLELTTNQTARDRILGDIAAAYAGLGLREAARDGYSIVAVTSPHRWVRWQATVNLMELAIDDDDEIAFDDYLNQLQNEPLEPRLRVYFTWYKARGFRQFDRAGWAELFDAAHSEAVEHRLHQLAHEVELEAQPHNDRHVLRASAVDQPFSELARIAEVLSHLREHAIPSISH